MLCDQFIGLNGRANQFLEQHGNQLCIETVATIYNPRTGSQEKYTTNTTRQESVGGKYSCHGMFDDEYQLGGFVLKDGTIVYEKLQQTIWSSGPMMFIALCREDGSWIEQTLWTEEEFHSQP